MKSNFIFTTRGFAKKLNEDQIGIRIFGDKTRICICDGHWGTEAALIACKTCLDIKSFPNNRSTTIELVESIQKAIFDKFGRLNMDPEKDFTPETSLLAVEIDSNNQLSIISYGDCRLMISNNKKILFKLKTVKTWLGAFSYLGLRNRTSVRKSVIFKKLVCKSNDLIWLFTDGIDECKYEKPTITLKWLAETGSKFKNLETITKKIIKKVENCGAEDNASIAIIKC